MILRRLAVTAVLMILLSVPVCAQTDANTMYDEQLSSSGADELIQHLPADVQEVLSSLSLDDFGQDGFVGLQLSSVLSMLVDLLGDQASGPLQTFAALMAVVVLSALFGGLEGMTDRPVLRQTYHTVSALAGAGLILSSFVSLLRVVQQAVDSVNVFMLSFVPVYAAIVTANGSPSVALSYQTTLLAAAQLLSQGMRVIVLPLLLVSLALGCIGTVSEGFNLASISQTFYKAVLWGIGLFSTAFSGVLSVQQMVSAAGDSVANRALKFSLASFVPVVGGTLSEAYSTVLGCAGLLRSTVGCFGLVATVLIVLPPMLACVAWNIALSLGANTAAMFGLGALERLCRCVGGAVRVLIAVLAVYGLLMVISTSVIVFVGRG
ncbi:MAG: hypothetical protein IJB26_05040 [Clostridia bacterium]|nr:hypothetical protein [Clostridia bacterium]